MHLLENTEDTQSCITSISSADPYKMLCQVREEYIFAFSGFNDRKLSKCEVFDS
jgi:hypothetical protein